MHDPITKGILDFKDIVGLRCCLVQQHFRFKTSVTLDLRVLSLVANILPWPCLNKTDSDNC